MAKRLQRLGAQIFAIAAQHVPALLRGAAEQLLDQARLADAGGTGHGHRTRRASQRLGQQLFQPFKVALAADEGCQAMPCAGLETRRQAGAGIDPVDQDRRVAALHLQGLRRTGDEKAAGRAERFFADQDLVRRGRIRQARGDVRHRPEQLEAAALDVASGDQHQPRMDAGVQAQGRAYVQFGRQFGLQLDAQFAHPLVQVERGVNGAPAIVFARDRVAEHRQQAIALHPHHHAAMLGDVHLVGAAQIGQQRGVVFGLHRPGQFGGM